MTEIIKSKVGFNRDRPRIWMQGDKLKNAGFKKNTKIGIQFFKGKIVIRIGGDRKVSGDSSIIDINTSKIYESFEQNARLLVRITNGLIIIKEDCTQ